MKSIFSSYFKPLVFSLLLAAIEQTKNEFGDPLSID